MQLSQTYCYDLNEISRISLSINLWLAVYFSMSTIQYLKPKKGDANHLALPEACYDSTTTTVCYANR